MTEPLSPDDRCGVCDEIRENHGDKNHKFSIEGELIPLKPGPDPRNQAPNPMVQQVVRDPLLGPLMRLVERLISANVLQEDDLKYIFGGGNETDRGQTPRRSEENNPPTGA